MILDDLCKERRGFHRHAFLLCRCPFAATEDCNHAAGGFLCDRTVKIESRDGGETTLGCQARPHGPHACRVGHLSAAARALPAADPVRAVQAWSARRERDVEALPELPTA